MRAARLDKPVRIPTDLYFIQTECPAGFIKVGIAVDVRRRMSKMQMDCPYRLKLLKRIKGAADWERQIHERFAEDRVTGEWFRPSDELLALIDDLEGETVLEENKSSGNVPTAYLDDADEHGVVRRKPVGEIEICGFERPKPTPDPEPEPIAVAI